MLLLPQTINTLFKKCHVDNHDYRAIHGTKIVFIGEPGNDYGGLTRELANFIVEEVVNKWKIFIKSPNQRDNTGTERDKWIPNPKSTSPTHLKQFNMLGQYIGICFRSSNLVQIPLPTLFWRFLREDCIHWSDYEQVDVNAANIAQDTESLRNCAPDMFQHLEKDFVTNLSDATMVPLCPNGENLYINAENVEEYIRLSKKVRMEEFLTQIKAIREGILQQIPYSYFSLFNEKSLEDKISGSGEIDVDFLKQITNYSGWDETDETIVWFWEIMNEFTQEERRAYVRYAWGRSRLTQFESEPHKLSKQYDQDSFPLAHTCFFEVELPECKSKEDLRHRVSFAMFECGDIVEEGSVDWGNNTEIEWDPEEDENDMADRIRM